MRRFLQGILLLLLGCPGLYAQTITIRDQASFDRMQERILEAVAAGGKTITVRIAPGSYLFHNNHLRLCGMDWRDVALRIEGQDCILTGAGETYCDADPFPGSFSAWETLVDEHGKLLDWFGEARKCTLPVSVTDASEKLCRIKAEDIPDRDEDECTHTYIKLTEWYRSAVYKVRRIHRGYIEFVADDLQKVSPIPYGYNVNYDLIYGQKMPRYRLCNVSDSASEEPVLHKGRLYLPEGSKCVRLCRSGCFLDVADVRLRSLTLSGITFVGNSRDANPSLIRYDRLHCQDGCEICDCTFRCIRSYLFHGRDLEGFHFHDNTIQDCPGFGLVCDIRTSGTRIEGNHFLDTGKDGLPSFCIHVSGDDYLIRGNSFRNFGYSAIAVGLGPEIDYPGPSRGIVEGNDLSYDDQYLQDIDRYGLMDSGAIYLTTRQDGTLIRGNQICNIGGIKDNRGIFCDDGARNFTIQDNTILGVANSYAIDSRRVDRFEERCGPTNVGITIQGNTTDSPIRFEGRPGDNHCLLGVNVLVRNRSGKYPSLSVKNISQAQKPVRQ